MITSLVRLTKNTPFCWSSKVRFALTWFCNFIEYLKLTTSFNTLSFYIQKSAFFADTLIKFFTKDTINRTLYTISSIKECTIFANLTFSFFSKAKTFQTYTSMWTIIKFSILSTLYLALLLIMWCKDFFRTITSLVASISLLFIMIIILWVRNIVSMRLRTTTFGWSWWRSINKDGLKDYLRDWGLTNPIHIFVARFTDTDSSKTEGIRSTFRRAALLLMTSVISNDRTRCCLLIHDIGWLMIYHSW